MLEYQIRLSTTPDMPAAPRQGVRKDVVMPFTLREPTLPDPPQIAELHVAAWREAYSHLLAQDFFSEEHIRSRHQM
ncbi:MAG TPA: hypothetical protein VLT34_01555 [Arthrobacter sp.]|nr:hypothetical protein [Arthrobacter sp.]